MKKLTKIQELITLAIKITPPPPPPRTHLNKHPRLKHLLIGITAILAIASCGGAGSTPLASLTYPTAPLKAEIGVQISDITPTLTPDGASGIYTVSPPLPDGLSLHETSGVISGTPTVLHNSTVHTVTAKGNEAYSGAVNGDITIGVFAAPEAVEIPKRAPADVRDSYVLFSISAGQLKTDYHLAVKEAAAESAPTSEEMSSGALKRNIGTESINVLIAQRLNAPMIDFARAYFADNSQTALGTDMTSTNLQDDFGLIFDDTAGGAEAWVAESVLKPTTEYALYGMDNGGTRVTRLLTVTTDSTLGPPTYPPDDTFRSVDTTLEAGHIEIAINANEFYIFPHQVELNPTGSLSHLAFFSSKQTAGDAFLTLATKTLFQSPPDPGYFGFLYLFKTVGTELLETLKKGSYVLINTGIPHSQTPPDKNAVFQFGYATVGTAPDTHRHSILRMQQ